MTSSRVGLVVASSKRVSRDWTSTRHYGWDLVGTSVPWFLDNVKTLIYNVELVRGEECMHDLGHLRQSCKARPFLLRMTATRIRNCRINCVCSINCWMGRCWRLGMCVCRGRHRVWTLVLLAIEARPARFRSSFARVFAQEGNSWASWAAWLSLWCTHE